MTDATDSGAIGTTHLLSLMETAMSMARITRVGQTAELARSLKQPSLCTLGARFIVDRNRPLRDGELSQTSNAWMSSLRMIALAMRLNISDTHAELVRNLLVGEALCHRAKPG